MLLITEMDHQEQQTPVAVVAEHRILMQVVPEVPA